MTILKPLCLVSMLLAVPVALAAEPEITYRPPAQAAASVRSIESEDRAGDRPLPSVAVLAPDHAGWTATDQPTLAFYQGDEGQAERIEVAITPADSFEPIFEATLPAQPGERVRQIRLADHDVKLDPAREYEWTVSAVATNDEGERLERTARAGIRYEPPDVPGAADAQPDVPRAIALAHGGVWYDAIAALSRVIDRGGEEAVTAHRLRGQLLRQVDLGVAADFDSRFVSAGPAAAPPTP